MRAPEKFMNLAIREAMKNLRSMRGGPFGACIVRDNRVLALARNTVLSSDATAHAEVNAIRKASRATGSYDLSGCEIYSTTEPCPMCFSAIHWARIEKIYYGTDIRDAAKIGFNEMKISNRDLKKAGRLKTVIVSGFMRNECLELFRSWDQLGNKVVY